MIHLCDRLSVARAETATPLLLALLAPLALLLVFLALLATLGCPMAWLMLPCCSLKTVLLAHGQAAHSRHGLTMLLTHVHVVEHADGLAVDDDVLGVVGHGALEAAVHGVVLEHVGGVLCSTKAVHQRGRGGEVQVQWGQ